jgi:hypothetical protein
MTEMQTPLMAEASVVKTLKFCVVIDFLRIRFFYSFMHGELGDVTA